jgi:uncharacterized Zn finger protein
MGYYSGGWAEYVPVAERRKKAEKHKALLKKKGVTLNPVVIEGRMIAKTFWGKAWCDNLEAYSDFSNRLPRGRTYVRNGSVIDLQITKGQVKAQVMGSSLYRVTIEIKPMAELKWKILVKACAGKIDSLIELLQGKFSKAVMEIITQKEDGLFPKPQEITMKCSCPDYASMCKHSAAVLYGIGAILDKKPEWLFDLRHVDQIDLIATASGSEVLIQNPVSNSMLKDDELSALFGIEMEADKTSIATESISIKKVKKQSSDKNEILEKPVKKSSPLKPVTKKKLTLQQKK